MKIIPTVREIEHGHFKIQVSPATPIPLERRPILFKYCHIVTWSIWLVYIGLELAAAAQVQATRTAWMWRVWAALFAQVALSFQELVTAVSTIYVLVSGAKERVRPRYKLIGDAVPSVDVLLPCCGEPCAVVVNTLEAVIGQDYTAKQLKIFVLDDGHDKALEGSVKALAKKSATENGAQVFYLSRELAAGEKSYFKAGNLQFGIDESAKLGGGEFLASLDADMIPERDWLKRILPHLILDDTIGLACPPQRYYNVPDGDPFGQQADFDLYFTLYECVNDRVDAAMCTGSGFVVRRQALVDIGGWPLIESGEDFMCSTKLANAGWKTAFIREYVQLGLCPGTMRSHLKQKMRWVDSGIEVHKRFGFYIWSTNIAMGMTLSQRVIGVFQALREYAPLTNTLALVLLPVALFPHVDNDFVALSTVCQPYLSIAFLVAYISHKFYDRIIFGHVGLHQLANWQSNEVWCAPFLAARCIASVLPKSINNVGFEASGAIVSSANERSRSRRKPIVQRIFNFHIMMCLSYSMIAAMVVCLRLYSYFSSEFQTRNGRLALFPLPGAFVKLIDVMWKATVPVHYMITPPTVPEREELVELDEWGIRRPDRVVLEETRIEAPGLLWKELCEICLISLMFVKVPGQPKDS